jgi:predicted DCC family thiol-disulfide oxidoreductase YuxK
MSEWRFKVLYDGECPLCRREVDWLKRRDKYGRLACEDISAPGFDASRYGVAREDAMGVMHGVFPDGRLVRKVEAIREAYRTVGLGWLVAPTGWPVFRSFFELLYALFARYRMPIGRLFGRRCDAGKCDVASRVRGK